MKYREGFRKALTALLLVFGTVTFVAVPVQAAEQNSVQNLNVGIGSHQLVRQPSSIARVALGDPKVADVNVVNARELLVLGKSQGSTSLLIWPQGKNARPLEYRVNVGSFSAAPDPEMSGLTVQPGAGIDGVAPNLYSHQRAVAQAAPTDKPVLADRSVVAVDTQVMSEVKIVEVNRVTAQQYGLNLFGYTNGGRNSFGGGASTPGGLNSVGLNSSTTQPNVVSPNGGGVNLIQTLGFTDAFNFVFGNRYFTSILSVLENKGLARTLAEPSLTATSGQTATFLAGGEFPVPVPQSSGSGSTTITIQYKEFGVRLNLTPTVLSSSRISLKIAPEVSELDYANGITLNGYTVPGLIVRRTDTTVELGDGETFVLSGLVSDSMKGSVDKVPLLGDLPIIGAFFKSNSYSRSEKELIMVVTPHLVRPMVKGAKLPELPGAQVEQYRPGFAQTMFLETGKFGQSDYGYSR